MGFRMKSTAPLSKRELMFLELNKGDIFLYDGFWFIKTDCFYDYNGEDCANAINITNGEGALIVECAPVERYNKIVEIFYTADDIQKWTT